MLESRFAIAMVVGSVFLGGFIVGMLSAIYLMMILKKLKVIFPKIELLRFR